MLSIIEKNELYKQKIIQQNALFVFAKLPNAGLANMLLVWAEASVFAHTHGKKLYISSWAKIKIGPFLRGESSKRLYLNYFKTPILFSIPNIVLKRFIFKACNIKEIEKLEQIKAYVCFDSLPPPNDFTVNLRFHRPLIKKLFEQLLHTNVVQRNRQFQSPEIGVHVRLGDFKLSNIQTPLIFYSKAIVKIREKYGQQLKVTIFSDGSDKELDELLQIPLVSRSTYDYDIDDLIQLSNSKYLILSQDSSFGYFAGLISNAILICKPSQKNGKVTDDIEEWIIN